MKKMSLKSALVLGFGALAIQLPSIEMSSAGESYLGTAEFPAKSVSSHCGKGTNKAKPMRNVFFSAKATSSYIADQPVKGLSDIYQADNGFPVYCSLLISNVSAAKTQWVRWAGRLAILQNTLDPHNEEGLAYAKTPRISKGEVMDGTRISLSFDSIFSSKAYSSRLPTEELNPAVDRWIELKAGEAIHLRLMGLLPRGLTPAVRQANNNSEGWIASQFCSGYIQACDETDASAPASEDRGILMVSGDMQYVADSPNNFKIRYASMNRDENAKVEDNATVSPANASKIAVSAAANCFRDQGRANLGYARIRGGLFDTVGNSKYHTRNSIDVSYPNKLYSYLNIAPLPETVAFEVDYKTAAAFYGDKGEEALCRFFAMNGARNYKSYLTARCNSSIIRTMNSFIGDDWTDLIEDVGQNRMLGNGTDTAGDKMNYCYSFNYKEPVSGVTTGNNVLQTGQFPQHMAIVPVVVNGGSKF